ncbi:MAG TPA: hypothetical protein VMK12_13790, partial [Anaeromyxobacteraceae bacterium]|nr:hypothetical protein [Anaeromyxobacteraceae bacterium]
GSFSIPNVPTGPFLLVLVDGEGVIHIVDGAATSGVDLGFDALGRPDLAAPSASTPVTFALSGLASVSASDQFQVTSSDADLWDVLGTAGLVAPAGTIVDDWFSSTVGGSQVVAGVPLALLGLDGIQVPGIPMSLLDPADTVYVHQLTAVVDSASGASYLAAVSYAAMSGAVVLANSTTVLTFPAGTVLSTGSLPGGTWSIAAFEALLPAMNPGATTDAHAHSLYVAASAGSLATAAPRALRAVPTMLALQLPGGTSPDPTLGALAYGQFLGPPWAEWLGLDFTAHLTYVAAGAASGFDETVAVGWREPNTPPAGSALAPTVGPVQYPAVTAPRPVQTPSVTTSNAFGVPPGAVLAGVSATPTIAWAAPVLGVPTSYTVDVYLLSPVSGATVSTRLATWSTLGTQVTLPPGVLNPGNTYYARITAVASPLPFRPNAPFRQANTYGYASTLTAPFTP